MSLVQSRLESSAVLTLQRLEPVYKSLTDLTGEISSENVQSIDNLIKDYDKLKINTEESIILNIKELKKLALNALPETVNIDNKNIDVQKFLDNFLFVNQNINDYILLMKKSYGLDDNLIKYLTLIELMKTVENKPTPLKVSIKAIDYNFFVKSENIMKVFSNSIPPIDLITLNILKNAFLIKNLTDLHIELENKIENLLNKVKNHNDLTENVKFLYFIKYNLLFNKKDKISGLNYILPYRSYLKNYLWDSINLDKTSNELKSYLLRTQTFYDYLLPDINCDSFVYNYSFNKILQVPNADKVNIKIAYTNALTIFNDLIFKLDVDNQTTLASKKNMIFIDGENVLKQIELYYFIYVYILTNNVIRSKNDDFLINYFQGENVQSIIDKIKTKNVKADYNIVTELIEKHFKTMLNLAKYVFKYLIVVMEGIFNRNFLIVMFLHGNNYSILNIEQDNNLYGHIVEISCQYIDKSAIYICSDIRKTIIKNEVDDFTLILISNYIKQKGYTTYIITKDNYDWIYKSGNNLLVQNQCFNRIVIEYYIDKKQFRQNMYKGALFNVFDVKQFKSPVRPTRKEQASKTTSLTTPVSKPLSLPISPASQVQTIYFENIQTNNNVKNVKKELFKFLKDNNVDPLNDLIVNNQLLYKLECLLNVIDIKDNINIIKLLNIFLDIHDGLVLILEKYQKIIPESNDPNYLIVFNDNKDIIDEMIENLKTLKQIALKYSIPIEDFTKNRSEATRLNTYFKDIIENLSVNVQNKIDTFEKEQSSITDRKTYLNNMELEMLYLLCGLYATLNILSWKEDLKNILDLYNEDVNIKEKIYNDIVRCKDNMNKCYNEQYKQYLTLLDQNESDEIVNININAIVDDIYTEQLGYEIADKYVYINDLIDNYNQKISQIENIKQFINNQTSQLSIKITSVDNSINENLQRIQQLDMEIYNLNMEQTSFNNVIGLINQIMFQYNNYGQVNPNLYFTLQSYGYDPAVINNPYFIVNLNQNLQSTALQIQKRLNEKQKLQQNINLLNNDKQRLIAENANKQKLISDNKQQLDLIEQSIYDDLIPTMKFKYDVILKIEEYVQDFAKLAIDLKTILNVDPNNDMEIGDIVRSFDLDFEEFCQNSINNNLLNYIYNELKLNNLQYKILTNTINRIDDYRNRIDDYRLQSEYDNSINIDQFASYQTLKKELDNLPNYDELINQLKIKKEKILQCQ